jgi:hypothetical protein
MSTNQNSGISNVQTYFGEKYTFKRKQHFLLGKYLNVDHVIGISYSKWEFIQALSILFREMSSFIFTRFQT